MIKPQRYFKLERLANQESVERRILKKFPLDFSPGSVAITGVASSYKFDVAFMSSTFYGYWPGTGESGIKISVWVDVVWSMLEFWVLGFFGALSH
ncbi:hypothetical protein JCM33374_g5152 [Metschnikowia sp. JCM 33374]|nr:hypothetical protein JCM33374_g5152 [Metschnikowia sp. JCM 33374]